MADDATKQQLDSIVSAIGFGIVSDFRDLRDAMSGFTSELQESNRLIEQVTRDTQDTGRSLDQFQKDTFRRRDDRQFKRLESQMERRAQLSGQRGEESMRRIASAIEGLQKKLSLGAVGGGGGDVDEEGIVDRILNTIGGAGTTALEVGGAAAGLGLAGKLLKGGLVVGGAAMLGAGAYAAYNYFGNEEGAAPEQAPAPSNVAPTPPAAPAAQSSPASAPAQSSPPPSNLAPASAPQAMPPSAPPAAPSPQQLRPVDTASGAQSTPTIAADVTKLGGTAAGIGVSAIAVKGAISLAQKTAQQKALAKVASRVPSYLSKFGSRIVGTIGAKSVPVFGALVGGYFAFNRFMSGDSWTAIGAEFVSGISPDIGGVAAGPAGYVAGVATTLAIQAYLISRDIYNEENAIDIRNGVVPNFDDLDMVEKTRVVKQVGNYVESYVNSLIGRSAATDSTVGVTPTSTSGSASTAVGAGVTTGVAQSIADNRANPPPSNEMPGGGEPPPTFSGGASTGAALAPSSPAPTSMPGGGPPQSTFSPMGGTQQNTSAPSGGSGAEVDESQSSSASDNLASVSTSSNQAGSISTEQDIPVVEILETGSGYNVVKLADGSVVRRSGDRNWRNNNPGNIEYGDFTKSHGAIGTDGRFAIFPDLATGRAAKAALLFEGKNYRDKTIAEAIYRWAPPSDNNPTDAYISRAAQGAGVDPSTPLSSLSQEQRDGMMNAMAKVEGMRPGKTQVIQPPAKPMAEGGKVTPLTADKPKAGRDLSADLKPIAPPSDAGGDEESMSSSVSPIDKRPRTKSVSDPVENKRNKISTYMPVMNHIFGTLSEELKAHMNGEVTADKAFKDAMNPIG